ncbi:glycosyltransferase family 4 protein [Qipengyuania qiaonensis]|uniref:Glycosyltransferase family 4 protein n=1 Tax=Qipengyuania qiaonensis TaxID=2867240 RepID=A0ABS7JEP8_9SPHN|nr:glycosyltransferase family 4 protein [Qipengyuania qiaonensis]MBX7484153.1 glycosyltransferase family 4 protein [Qipengyuania qiaonensis]
MAKAAVQLVAKGRASPTTLVEDAVALHQDSLVIGAYGQVSLRQFDAVRLKATAEMARARADEFPELRTLIREIEAGPLRAIALMERLADRCQQSIVPVPKRIAYVLDRSLPYASNGYAMRSHRLARSLLDKGADIVCLTRPGFPSDLESCQRDYDSLTALEIVDGVGYHRIHFPLQRDFARLSSDITAHAPLRYLERAAETLMRQFVAIRPSCVIAASNFVAALPASLAARQLGLPFVYEVRGFWEITRASRDPDYLQSPMGRQEIAMEASVARTADAVITLTDTMRDELVARGVTADRVTIAPNAADVNTFRPKPRSERLLEQLNLDPEVPVIGYIGSFMPYEGLDDLVKACGQLKAKGMGFRLLLVGSEPPNDEGAFPVTDEICELIDRGGLKDWLIMPGRVPHEEVAEWYSLVDIAPFPRKSLPVSELVSPLKPLEAMAMEKAIVVSSVGGMREMVHDGRTGLVFTKDDVTALTDTLLRLLQDVPLQRKLGRAGRKWVRRKRSWDSVADVLLGVASTVTLSRNR